MYLADFDQWFHVMLPKNTKTSVLNLLGSSCNNLHHIVKLSDTELEL